MKNEKRNSIIMQCGKCKSHIDMHNPICPNCGEDNSKKRLFKRQVKEYHNIKCANTVLIFVAFFFVFLW